VTGEFSNKSSLFFFRLKHEDLAFKNAIVVLDCFAYTSLMQTPQTKCHIKIKLEEQIKMYILISPDKNSQPIVAWVFR